MTHPTDAYSPAGTAPAADQRNERDDRDERDPVDTLAEDFVRRLRRGERPTLAEYVERRPDLADAIRRLFPALQLLEQLKPAPADLAAGSAPGEVPAGCRQVGDYRLLREVGRGGMGIVYEAEQMSLGRRVALKLLPAHGLLDPTFLERFRREARAAAALHHTNIVPVFSVGEANGVAYYAMQFIHGQALDRVLDDLHRLRCPGSPGRLSPAGAAATSLVAAGRAGGSGRESDPYAETLPRPGPPVPCGGTGPLGSVSAASAVPEPPPGPPSLSASRTGRDYYRAVARIGRQVADALAHAHGRGLLHRDIKPSNLLLDTQGTAWVTDFGLAKVEGAGALTETGDVLGTLRYLPPERFQGQSLPEGDVYSLGLTLYELLALRPAFPETEKARLVEQVLHATPPPPSRFDPQVPRDLETVVLKCLHKDPARRYARARDLADDLDRFLADRPVRARRAGPVEQAWRWADRNPLAALLLASVAVLLAALAAGGLGMSLSLRRAYNDLASHHQDLEQAHRQGEERLLRSYLAEARARRYGGRPGQRVEALAALRQAAELARRLDQPPELFDELRTLAASALSLPDLRSLAWEGRPAGDEGVVVDLDRLDRFARIDLSGDLTLLTLPDQAVLGRLTGAAVHMALFEPGADSLLVVRRDGGLVRWHASTGHVHRLRSEGGSPVFRTRLADDGRRLLLVCGTVDSPRLAFEVLDLADGRRLYRGDLLSAPGPWVSAWRVDLAPDGRRLAWVKGPYRTPEGRDVGIILLDEGREEAVLHHEGPCGYLGWHPDGQTLAVGGTESSTVHLWDAPRGRRLRDLHDLRGGEPCPEFSSDGQLLAARSDWGRGLTVWGPSLTRPVLRVADTVSAFPFRGGGRLGVWQAEGRRVRLDLLEASPILRTLVRGLARPPGLRDWRGLAVHPGGRLLAVGTHQGVSFFDLDTGLDVGFLDVGMVHQPRFAADSGDLLVAGAKSISSWPVRSDPEDPAHLRLGPPRVLTGTPPIMDGVLACDRAGTVLAAPCRTRALIWHRAGERAVTLGPLGDNRRVEISPDGRWVVTWDHDLPDGRLEVWDAATGELARRLDVGSWPAAFFSPDGRWLAATGRTGCLLRVGTWEEEPRPGWSAGLLNPFSPDGRWLLGTGEPGRVALHDAATGRKVLVLELPDEARPRYACFSPDGRRLLLSAEDQLATYVWDLSVLRHELAALGLDWDDPPAPPPAAPPPLPRPLRLEIIREGK